jgi:hypothetical protein
MSPQTGILRRYMSHKFVFTCDICIDFAPTHPTWSLARERNRSGLYPTYTQTLLSRAFTSSLWKLARSRPHCDVTMLLTGCGSAHALWELYVCPKNPRPYLKAIASKSCQVSVGLRVFRGLGDEKGEVRSKGPEHPSFSLQWAIRVLNACR